MKEDKKQFEESNSLFAELPLNPNGSMVPAEIPDSILGTVFIGTGTSERAAMEAADGKACAYAKSRETCFHPSRLYSRTEKDGVWTATAIAANHRGSCPKYPPPQRNNYCWSWEY